jgi:hypothetical protein
LAGRAVGLVHAVMAKRRRETSEEAENEPAVITSPHFGITNDCDEQPLVRAA